jgi:hypothetical protein
MRRWGPVIAVAVVLAGASLASFALGGTERRPSAVPPLQTARLRALWGGDASTRAGVAADDDFAPAEDETPTLNVLTAGGLPEEPGRHDFETAMDKVRRRVEECGKLEQFVGTVQVHLVIDRGGGVRSAKAMPPVDETRTGQCVAQEVRHASFARFRGDLTPTIELIYPFYFRPSDN